MKTKIEVEIKPFIIPNFVTIEGDENAKGVPLSALDSYALDKLCTDFREGVFGKAGKSQPPICKEG